MTLQQALGDLQELTGLLRRECPWDAEQTPRTIVPHTVEEAYEVADAAMAEDDAKLLDELGDLLYQTFFLSLLLSERGAGDLEAVARGVHEKLVRRHPHVFEDAPAPGSPDAVKHRWEELKTEREGRSGVFHDVPGSLPALLYARKVQRRAAAVGFEYPGVAGALKDLDAELAELKQAIADVPPAASETEPPARHVEELGDALFAAVNVARRLNVDPELALRWMSDRFVARFERAERLAAADGHDFGELEPDRQDRYFDLAKEDLP